MEDTAGADEVTLSRKFGNEEYVCCHFLPLSFRAYVSCSIRLIFSIADIQTEQEAEFEEGEEPAESEESEQPLHSYPIRCSFSFTKVSTLPLTALFIRSYSMHARAARLVL